MVDSIVVVGAGGFGREVLDVVDAINSVGPTWKVIGVADDAPTEANLTRLADRGVSYIGTLEQLTASDTRCAYVIGVGSTSVRRTLADLLDAAGFHAATVVHPTVTSGFDVSIGDGSVVCAGVRLTTNIAIGRHVHLNLSATVGHDSTIGDFVSVNPLASISGDCTIGDGVLIGVAAVVLNQVAVGENATVGGSACVVKDVSAGVTVKGVPAK